MRRLSFKQLARRAGLFLWSVLCFFLLIAFVLTVSFLLFFYGMKPDEAAVRDMAPLVFFNAIALAVLFAGIDAARRYITVILSTHEINRVLERLMDGDFSARVNTHRLHHSSGGFTVIARQINRLAEELSGVETLRSDFISNVSHELKTPLSVMQNYATLLRSPDLSEGERESYAKQIFDASQRLSELVTNILRLDKLEHQQIFPAMGPMDLGEQLCECLLSFEKQWESKGLEIQTELPEGVIIRGDAELLSLVWNNLISNAVKFTGPGGTIRVQLWTEGDAVSVAISDTGCGMSSEVGAHIFERFYQGDASHATMGNGLGLSLVKRVVDILQGDIHITSAPGCGTTFTVTLRRQDHEAL